MDCGDLVEGDIYLRMAPGKWLAMEGTQVVQNGNWPISPVSGSAWCAPAKQASWPYCWPQDPGCKPASESAVRAGEARKT